MAEQGSEEYHDHPLTLCDKHKKQKIEQYCDTHNVLCCGTCIVLAHRSCKITAIKKKSRKDNQPKLIKESLRLIQNLQQNIQQIKTTQENGIKSLETNKDKCFTEVRALKKELDNLFIKLEKEVLDEVIQKEAIIKSQIDKQITESQFLLQQLADCKSMLEDCQSTRDDELMYIGIDKSRDDIKNMAKLVAELKDDMISTDLQFEAQQDVNDMRKKLKRMGIVKSGRSMTNTVRATGATSRVSGVSDASQRTSDDTSDMSTGNTAQATGGCYTANVSGVTVSSQRALDVKSKCISGSTFLENGELVLCDYENSKLLLFSPDLTLKAELKMAGNH